MQNRMYISSLDKIYENAESISDNPPNVYYVNSKAIEKLYSLNYLMYKEITDRDLSDTWKNFCLIILNFSRYLRYPIPPNVIYENIVSKKLKLIQEQLKRSLSNLDDAFKSNFSELRDTIIEVGQINESVVLNKTLDLIDSTYQGKPIAVVDEIFNLASKYSGVNLSFRKSSQLRPLSFLSEKLFLYDTPDYLEERKRNHLLISPKTKDINFILYDYEKVNSFQVSKIDAGNERGHIALEKSFNVNAYRSHSFSKLEKEMYQKNIDRIKLNSEYEDSIVEALPCVIGDTSIIYLELDKKYHFVEFENSEEYLCTDVIKLSCSSIVQDTLLILTTSGGGDQIEPIANDLIGIKSQLYRENQRLWKNKLRSFIAEKGPINAAKIIYDNGAENSNLINIKNWASGYNLGPSLEGDFKSIMNIILPNESYKNFWKTIKELRRYHTKAGKQIHTILKNKIYGMSVKPALINGSMNVADSYSSAEKMILLITDIKHKESVNRAICNKVIDITNI